MPETEEQRIVREAKQIAEQRRMYEMAMFEMREAQAALARAEHALGERFFYDPTWLACVIKSDHMLVPGGRFNLMARPTRPVRIKAIVVHTKEPFLIHEILVGKDRQLRIDQSSHGVASTTFAYDNPPRLFEGRGDYVSTMVDITMEVENASATLSHFHATVWCEPSYRG